MEARKRETGFRQGESSRPIVRTQIIPALDRLTKRTQG